MTLQVRIHSSAPMFVEADADQFGKIFALMNDDEQAAVLKAMVEHMKPHQMQWDYIVIKMEGSEEFSETLSDLRDIFRPEGGAA